MRKSQARVGRGDDRGASASSFARRKDVIIKKILCAAKGDNRPGGAKGDFT